jgi:hypothetical protein
MDTRCIQGFGPTLGGVINPVIGQGFHIVLRAGSACVGALLIYLGAFTYQDERGRIQNRLTDLWMSVQLLQESAIPWQTALIRRTAELLVKALDVAFGGQWLSIQVALTSAFLSLSSAFLLEPFTKLVFAWPNHPLCMLIGINMLVMSLEVGAVLKARRYGYLAICMLGQIGVTLLCSFKMLQRLELHDLIAYRRTVLETLFLLGATLVFGIVVDLLCLILTRILLGRIAGEGRGWLIAPLFAATSLWAGAIGWTLWLATGSFSEQTEKILMTHQHLLATLGLTPLETVNAITIAVSTNGYNFLFACGLVVLLSIAALHRTMYPALGRIIFGISEFFINANRKVLIAVGSGFLALAGMPSITTLFTRLHI